jgi:hypothetical protein
MCSFEAFDFAVAFDDNAPLLWPAFFFVCFRRVFRLTSLSTCIIHIHSYRISNSIILRARASIPPAARAEPDAQRAGRPADCDHNTGAFLKAVNV